MVWERGSRTCKSTKDFTIDRATYNVQFFFKFCWDGCMSGPRIALEMVNPWHLSIVRAKARMIGICSIRNNETSVWKLDEYILFQYWVDANNVGPKFKI